MTTKITQSALAKPPISLLRKTSIRTVMTIQIQITQKKKMIMDQKTSRNG